MHFVTIAREALLSLPPITARRLGGIILLKPVVVLAIWGPCAEY